MIFKLPLTGSIREKTFRWGFFVIGILLLSLGISLTIQAREVGIGPWDVLHYGLYSHLGLTIGSWAILVGLFIVAVSSIVMKSIPKIGTVINMIFVGIFIDLFNLLFTEPTTLWGCWVVLLIGIVISAFGIGIYVPSEIGAGPRDSLMLALTRLTKLKVGTVRNGLEIIVAFIGWLLGGPLGLGTIVTALLLGTFVGYTLPFGQKLINELIKRGERDENINKRKIRIDHYDRISKKAGS
ncbi:YitT family protein [Bacillaceae bacterium S4-13-58]